MRIFKVIIILIGILIHQNSNAQLAITTHPPSQVDSILQNVFFGAGVGSVSNATVTGVPGAFATFTGTSNLGFNNGIILSTDNANYISNPASQQISGPSTAPGDPQLQTLSPFPLQDAAVLEFDFSPATDTLRFSYVFGSEEYPEYVCSQFNDVFGFFITGQNPAGGNYYNFNVAQIPGTTLPVSINTVNPGLPGANSGGGFCNGPTESLAYSSLYVNNLAGSNIIFDGLTTVLSITIPVVVCDNYHIKLAVANCSDGVFDSGVFLQENSFGGAPARIHSQSGPGVIALLDTTILNVGVSTQLTAAKSTAYLWSNGDTTQTITVSQQGSVSFYVMNPANGCIAFSAPRMIIVDSSVFVGVDNMIRSNLIEIAPNPFKDETTIQFNQTYPTESIIRIQTLSGKLIKTVVMQPFADNISLSLQDLPKGIYLLEVNNLVGNVVKRIVRE